MHGVGLAGMALELLRKLSLGTDSVTIVCLGF